MNEQNEPNAGQEEQPGIKRPLTKDIDVVNLNTATVEELSRLPGIGAKLAGRIVEYRAKEHPFRETAEITKVRGISAAMYAAIADLLAVGPAEPEELALPAEPEEPAPVAEPEAAAPAVEPEAPAPAVEVRELPPVAPPPSAPPAPREALRPRPQPAPEPRRGAGWPALLAVGVASAILGACLALVLLLAINGTLKFGSGAVVSDLKGTIGLLDGRAGGLAADLSETQGRLDEMQGRLDKMQGRLDETEGRLTAAQAELKAVNQEMSRVGGDVKAVQDRFGALEARFGGLTEDLQAVRQAARRMDAFLGGLRELLDQMQGPAGGVTPLPQAPNPTRKPVVTVIIPPQPTPTP